MPPAGFEPAILASERPQTHAFARAAAGISTDAIESFLLTVSVNGNASLSFSLINSNMNTVIYLHANEPMLITMAWLRTITRATCAAQIQAKVGVGVLASESPTDMRSCILRHSLRLGRILHYIGRVYLSITLL